MRHPMTITTTNGQRQFTEADLKALSIRFQIQSKDGVRTFFVDGAEVSEPEYNAAFTATQMERRRDNSGESRISCGPLSRSTP